MSKTLADVLKERIQERREKLRQRVQERRILEEGRILSNIKQRIESIRSNILSFRSQVKELTEKQKELAEKFAEGIAEALGVPKEAIRKDVVEKWVIEWTKAFVTPEYWEKLSISSASAYSLGYHLGSIVKSHYASLQRASEKKEAVESMPSRPRLSSGGMIY